MRANERASGPVLTSLFLFVPDHSAVTPGDIMSVKLEIKQYEPEDTRIVVEFIPARNSKNGSTTKIVHYLSSLQRPRHNRAQIQ